MLVFVCMYVWGQHVVKLVVNTNSIVLAVNSNYVSLTI